MSLMFRRREGDSIWHFSEDCTEWPKWGGFFQTVEKPSGEDLCSACQAAITEAEASLQEAVRAPRQNGVKSSAAAQ